jgi:hypothetical protein
MCKNVKFDELPAPVLHVIKAGAVESNGKTQSSYSGLKLFVFCIACSFLKDPKSFHPSFGPPNTGTPSGGQKLKVFVMQFKHDGSPLAFCAQRHGICPSSAL